MAFSYPCLISQRFLLPLILALSSLVRPVGISFVYLLVFFVSPFIPIATQRNFKRTISAYLLLLVAISTLVILCHVGLQITLAALGKDALGDCTVTARLLKHIGFISFFDQKPLVIVLWLLPDVAVLSTSIAVFLAVRSAVRPKTENVEQGGEELQQTVNNSSDVASTSRRSTYLLIPNFDRLIDIAPMFCLATLFFAGALRPSVQGGFYFLVFLLCGSYWATFKSLQRGFAIFLRFVAALLVLHIIAIVSYQLEWSQEYLSSDKLVARLLALEPLIDSGCHKYMEFSSTYKADSYLSPIFILVAYYTLILSSSNLVKRRVVAKPLSAYGQQLENGTKITRQKSVMATTTKTHKRDSWTKQTQRLNVSICRDRLPEPNETTPLVRHPTNVRGSTRRSLSQHIQMDSLDTNQNEETTSSFFDQICYGIISVAGFIYQNSYIFTNILMMTWSIIYHSWLGFVFLLWANIMWMIPNQRKAMMRSSPVIVLYAEVLVIIQYLYSMNLNEDELPTAVNTTGINLKQIGLEKNEEDQPPILHLVIKSSMLLMFWVTLRQFFKEKHDKRRSSTIADMVAPLQMAVGAAAIGHKEKKKSSKFLKKMGDMLKNFLVRLWIWLLIFVIFLCAITGTQMTAFRVFYMALFLFFLLVFQLSSKIWVKVMYGFWIFLIIYAMTILTLIYTYQFDKFSQYWSLYLNVSKELQTDIGLENYKTKELFLHLLPPTLIVILTVIQVHYFHKRFVASLLQQSIKPNPSSSIDMDGVNAQSSTQLDDSSETYLSDSATSKFQNIKNVSKRFCQRLRSITKNLAISFKEIFWRFLELHLIKGVYLTAFLCCIHELCILHIPAIFLCILGNISRSDIKLYTSKFISLIFCIITLTKMIYQVQYMDHDKFVVNCTNNITGNNAEWFGLQKTSENQSLVQIIKPYIAYMVIATLHAVVSLRQSRMRTLYDDSNIKVPLVLFPSIQRIDAEKNITGALKYLMNYGYYKFGLEICFIAIVGLAAFRKDVISIFYILWLCILIPMKRSTCAKAWSTFLFFTGVVIILQYLLFVGLPPGLCLEYPWTKTDYSEPLQAWALMPGDLNIRHNSKLIFDFIVFMLINRQKKVFDIEAKNIRNYPGGSNKSVVADIENLGLQDFDNPTSDFLSSIRDWLDIIKNAILCGFFWVTLAVVFLAGTNIGDIMAIGYLLGSFIFLWQGSDFYLRPIRGILFRWNILLAYNVVNIAIKVVLQFPACIYMKSINQSVCFLIHLFGIRCYSVKQTFDDQTTGFNDTCPPIDESYSFLIWDAICFAFIIFQLRIFKSHYFCHIINDTKANTLLASRGAEIIEDLRKKQIEHRHKHEQEVLHKIKKKMEKIRATQNKLRRTTDKPTHFDEIAPTARVGSFSSIHGSGYHTPVDIEEGNNQRLDEYGSEFPSELAGLCIYPPPPENQVPTPTSVATIPLEGFLDPKRLSYCSPPGSEFQKQPSEDSSVFLPDRAVVTLLPPENDRAPLVSSNSSGISNVREHRRQSSGNTVSWNEPLLATCLDQEKIAEENHDQAESENQIIIDSTTVTLRNKQLHRRHISMGNATYSLDDKRSRRSSNLSWSRDDSTSARPYSWGPVGTMYFLESLSMDCNNPSSHAESIRAGDYYMFDDVDEKFELDLIDDETDFLESEGKISEIDKKIAQRKSVLDVYKDIGQEQFKKSLVRSESQKYPPNFEKPVPPASALSEPLPIIVYQKENVTEVKGRPSLSALTPGSQKRHSAKDIHADVGRGPDDVDASTSTAAKQVEEEETGEEEQDVPARNPIVRLLEGLLVSIAVRLNRFSRNYRYVMKILAEEKKTLKESKGFEKLGKLGVASIWTPLNVLRMQVSSLVKDEPHTSSQLISPNTHQTDTNTDDIDSNSDIIHDTQLVQSTPRKTIGSQGSIARPSTTGRKLSCVPEIRVQAPSLERGLDDSGSNSKQWSYENMDSTGDFSFEEEFADKDHHIVLQVLISLWYAILSNTDLICYTVVFISQCVNATAITLPLPFMVFLWGTLSLPRPTKTFWVTLIGYTQALVLLKCLFQFNIISTTYIRESSNPLSAANIMGLMVSSKNANYDLVLLLVLFFHRFILKSQGLWKSEYKEEHQEGAYVMRDELPDSDDHASQQSLDETILVTKGDQTVALGRTEHIVHEDQINFQLNTTAGQPGEYIPGIHKLTGAKYFSTIREFFNNIVNKARLPTDVYAFMFLCDFINFFVLLFGFTAFASQQSEGGFQTYLTENKVPVPFLVMLLLQFLLIITDRALYLRKSLVYKIIFHFVSVIAIHIWMFFVVPIFTERSFNSSIPPVFFYATKCFYFLWSAYQIKCGFPKRILGNVLTKSFSLVNMILFKVYMNLPFLYELRTILDWVCTDTTMTLFDWLKMEDIFSDIYFIKCSRQMETDFPVIRAQKKAIISKLFLGGIMILMIVIAIWGPLCLFALASAVGVANIPTSAAVNIRIGSYDPLYHSSTEENIINFNDNDYNTLVTTYQQSKHATAFLSNYKHDDVAAVMLPGNSSSVWEISPPDMTRLLDDLTNNKTLSFRFQYSFFKFGARGDEKVEVKGYHTFSINETFPARKGLINMLQGNTTATDYIEIPFMLPKFLKILNTGALSEISDLKPLIADSTVLRNLLLRLHPVGTERNDTKGIFWWEVRENCSETEPFYENYLAKLPYASCQNELLIYTFNDRRFPSHFSFLTAGGIIGLYTTFVLLISRLLKGFLSGQNRRIMFEDLPYVDRVLQLCLDIYLVREALEFALEEDLFAKLLFLYRSPETMIKWTRPKEEVNDDETDTESIRSKSSGHRKQD